MLTCYGDEVRLPQSDLAYVGFRLTVLVVRGRRGRT
jgi:hypothetical protein